MENRAIIDTKKFKTILKYVSSLSNGKQIAMMFKFSFMGLRLCNWYRLQIQDVCDSQGKVKDVISLTSDKNKGSRGVNYYMTDDMKEDIKEYIKDLDTSNPKTYLFISQKTGKPYCKNSLTNLFHKIYADLGIENCSTHCGRRNFITNLLVNGVDITSVKTLVGHRHIQTTSLYYNENPTMLKNIVNNNKI